MSITSGLNKVALKIKRFKVPSRFLTSFEYLPAKYKVNGVEKFERFEILEVEEDKGKKTKVVVINSKFEICDNDKLKEWSTLKIYSANPQRKQSSTTN